MRGASWHTLSPEKKKQTGKPGSKTQLGTGGALLEMAREVLGRWGALWCLVGQWGTSQGMLRARLGSGCAGAGAAPRAVERPSPRC